MSKTTISSTVSSDLGIQQVQSLNSGSGDGGSEVVSHFNGKLYVTNGEDNRIDIFDAATGTLHNSLDLTQIPGYDGVNSVAASAAGIAVAVEITDLQNPDANQNGVIALYNLDALSTDTPTTIEVGNLPDMVTFSKDGTKIFNANEGEPTDAGDPAGSISVIDVATMTAITFDFSQFDSQIDALREAGVRIFPDTLPSTDFEPEYIAEGADGNLYITLQEANAIAVFSLDTMAFTKIIPLGTVDHSVEGYGIDPSDRDDGINIHTVPVLGLRMPDAITTAEINGVTYLLTANEGDARDEDVRIADVILDPTAFPDAEALQADEELGRLNISSIDGDTDGDGDIDVLYAYGSRSFTIFDTDGNVVFDSGDDFEQLIAELRDANAFNNDDYPSGDADTTDENRSDNKGPEPEAIEVGVVDGRTLAFIGLERDSGIMIYDITDPANSVFIDYIESSENGDISPEVIEFIASEDSTTGRAQIAVSYEVSGTTTLFDLEFGGAFHGTQQEDQISGTIGDDTMIARDHADVLLGKGGDDLMRGGAGNDQMLGGIGDDTLYGGTGNDQMLGGSGTDALYGGVGRDDISGGIGNDDLHGGLGRDTLNGGAGRDTLNGGVARDFLTGGTGNDTLTGGGGDDVFVFALGDGTDTITDLSQDDRINLAQTGLEFADLTITQTATNTFTVEYGTLGDTINVTTIWGNTALTVDDFTF